RTPGRVGLGSSGQRPRAPGGPHPRGRWRRHLAGAVGEGRPVGPVLRRADRANSTMALATPEMFDWPAVCDARILHLSGITLALSDSSRELVRRAVEEG